MKIAERHIIILSIAMSVTAIGLFIYLPFISVKQEVTITIDIEELCRVDVEENEWEYVCRTARNRLLCDEGDWFALK